MKLNLKKNYKVKNINFRASESEFNKIKRFAMLYAEGNISAYCLYCALNFKVMVKDLKGGL